MCPTRPRIFPNYELELANFAAIPDYDQELKDEESLSEPKEPAPANLDPFDLQTRARSSLAAEQQPDQGGSV